MILWSWWDSSVLSGNRHKYHCYDGNSINQPLVLLATKKYNCATLWQRKCWINKASRLYPRRGCTIVLGRQLYLIHNGRGCLFQRRANGRGSEGPAPHTHTFPDLVPRRLVFIPRVADVTYWMNQFWKTCANPDEFLKFLLYMESHPHWLNASAECGVLYVLTVAFFVRVYCTI